MGACQQTTAHKSSCKEHWQCFREGLKVWFNNSADGSVREAPTAISTVRVQRTRRRAYSGRSPVSDGSPRSQPRPAKSGR